MLYRSINRYRHPARILGIFLAVAVMVVLYANVAAVATGCKTTCCCCPPTNQPDMPGHARGQNGLPSRDCCSTGTMPHCDMQPGPAKNQAPLNTAVVHPETPQAWVPAGGSMLDGINVTADRSMAICLEPAPHRPLPPIYLQNQSFLC